MDLDSSPQDPTTPGPEPRYPSVEVPTWVPTPKQAEFLAAGEFEVLYGGAAGGGKTEALIVDALGGNQPGGPAIQSPTYRAVLVRPSYPELKDVRDRMLNIYPQFVPGVRWLEGKTMFLFPSGAQIELTYLKEDADKYRFQGREIQYFGWEELTQHASGSSYEFIFSRMRAVSTSGLHCYIRATTNPGGVGHEWVKEHWKIDDEGSASSFKMILENMQGLKMETHRRFIPAGVPDNPHLDPTYDFRLSMLSEDLQQALRYGRWDVVDVEGVVLRRQVEAMLKEERLTEIPFKEGTPVNTFWDIGRDMIAIWYHQRVGAWDHLIDFSSFTGETLATAAREIQRKPYVYGAHYLPHDAEHRSVKSDKNAREILRDLKLKPIVVVPRIDRMDTGIELLRQSFSSLKIDRQRCAEGFKALRNYRYQYDSKLGVYSKEPLHNWASHPSDALRQFAQGYRGDIRTTDEIIKELTSSGRRRSRHDSLLNPSADHIL